MTKHINAVDALNKQIDAGVNGDELEQYRQTAEGERLELLSVIEEASKPAEPAPPSLMERANLLKYFDAVANKRGALDGAEKELNEELGLDIYNRDGAVDMPIDVFAFAQGGPPEEEQYADAVTSIAKTNAPTTTHPIIGRLFKNDIASWLGIPEVMVAAGNHDYPYVTAGTSADFVAESAALDAGALTLAVESLDPHALTGAFLYTGETVVRWGEQIVSAMDADLLGVIGEKLNDELLNGDGATPTRGKGILNRISSAALADGDTGRAADDVAMTWGDYLKSLVAHQSDPEIYGEDVAILMNKDAYSHGFSLFRSSNAGEMNALQSMRAHGARIRWSGHMPDSAAKSADAGAKATALLMKRPEMVVRPIWRRMELIRDHLTKANIRQTRITAVVYANLGYKKSSSTTVYGSRKIDYVTTNKT